MKILALEYGHNVQSIDESIVCYPDSTLTRNNDDFYFPNFTNELVAYVGIYIQFTKIGKCLEPRFVNRYYSEVGVGIKFMANDVIVRNHTFGTATDIARGFDSSLAVSNEKQAINTLHLDSLQAKINEQQIPLSLDFSQVETLVSIASQYFTIKIGDLFFLPCQSKPLSVHIGDVFDVSLNGEQMLTCTIK